MPDPISKQRRSVRRTNKQQRDHRTTGTQFTRSVNPYVRAVAKRDDDAAYAMWLRNAAFTDVSHLLTITKED
jgi:hypothetical protein